MVIGKKTPESKARDLQKRLESVGLRVELEPVLSLAASANREKGLEMARLEKRLREQIRAKLMKEMGWPQSASGSASSSRRASRCWPPWLS